jgi:ligand-binding sensor domain-containing protein
MKSKMYSYKTVTRTLSFIVLLSLLIPALPLSAQQNTFRHLTTRDGLTAGYIEHMMQDSNGFIWIGTASGLNRYDGYDMISYRPDPEIPTAITGARVLIIEELNPKQFLVGTTNGLNLLNPLSEEFTLIQLTGNTPQINYTSDIHIMDNGDVWVTSNYGLFHLPNQNLMADSLKAKYYPLLEEDQIDGQNELIKNFAYNENGLLIIGTSRSTYTFNIYDDDPFFAEVTPSDSYTSAILKGDIWDVTVAKDGTVYLSSTAGIARWGIDNPEPEAITEIGPLGKNDLENASFQSVSEDEDGKPLAWNGTHRCHQVEPRYR